MNGMDSLVINYTDLYINVESYYTYAKNMYKNAKNYVIIQSETLIYGEWNQIA